MIISQTSLKQKENTTNSSLWSRSAILPNKNTSSKKNRVPLMKIDQNKLIGSMEIEEKPKM